MFGRQLLTIVSTPDYYGTVTMTMTSPTYSVGALMRERFGLTFVQWEEVGVHYLPFFSPSFSMSVVP